MIVLVWIKFILKLNVRISSRIYQNLSESNLKKNGFSLLSLESWKIVARLENTCTYTRSYKANFKYFRLKKIKDLSSFLWILYKPQNRHLYTNSRKTNHQKTFLDNVNKQSSKVYQVCAHGFAINNLFLSTKM